MQENLNIKESLSCSADCVCILNYSHLSDSRCSADTDTVCDDNDDDDDSFGAANAEHSLKLFCVSFELFNSLILIDSLPWQQHLSFAC